MDDFKPGDQAQCIRNTDFQDRLLPGLQLFNIYTVRDVQCLEHFCLQHLEYHSQVQIQLKEVAAPLEYWGFLPEFFRKPPPLPEEEITRQASRPRIRELEPTS